MNDIVVEVINMLTFIGICLGSLGVAFFCYFSMYYKEFRLKIFKKKMLRFVSKKKKEYEFEEIYNYIVSDLDIDQMKSKRIRDKICSVALGIGFFGDIILIFVLNFCSKIYNLDINYGLVYFCILLAVIVPLIVMVSTKGYNDYFFVAQKAIDKLLLMINPKIKLKCETGSETPKDIVKELYLFAGFDDTFNRSEARNCVEYELNSGNKAFLAEIHLKNKKYKGGTILEFQGICSKIFREKLVENEILIRIKKVIKTNNSIKCDDEFGKYFDLVAINKLDAETRINDTVRAEIVKLYKEYGIMFEVSLKGKFLYIRFFSDSLFDESSIINKNRLYKEYIVFKSVLEIIEKLNNIL